MNLIEKIIFSNDQNVMLLEEAEFKVWKAVPSLIRLKWAELREKCIQLRAVQCDQDSHHLHKSVQRRGSAPSPPSLFEHVVKGDPKPHKSGDHYKNEDHGEKALESAHGELLCQQRGLRAALFLKSKPALNNMGRLKLAMDHWTTCQPAACI